MIRRQMNNCNICTPSTVAITSHTVRNNAYSYKSKYNGFRISHGRFSYKGSGKNGLTTANTILLKKYYYKEQYCITNFINIHSKVLLTSDGWECGFII